ncbi:hypothetical protein CONPUDRAFT_27690, partial [Coniophora puteana RWD-64-598 SS2]
MKTFFTTVLGFDLRQMNSDGVLGRGEAYYGTVEAQGRGTLHCHMLVWLVGSMNPDQIMARIIDERDNEFEQKLLSYLDDCVSSSIPTPIDPAVSVESDHQHPCSVYPLSENASDSERSKDLHNVANKSQRHKHGPSCYKYWRGPPEPKTCRYDLDEDNGREHSLVDHSTRTLYLRCLDGMVNTYNPSILELMRCNMDIKYVGSGQTAKAILHYITDYITKTQLKTHVAYAAIETAVTKLGEFNPASDDVVIRSKKLLQKCAYSLISRQELSAQQVAAYLLGYNDHLTSHRFRRFYWGAFERFIRSQESACPGDSSLDTVAESDDVPSEDTGDKETEELLEHEPEEDEVMVDINNDGTIVAVGSRVQDYVWRGHELDDQCL